MVEFSIRKYGPPLPVDVAWIHDMPSFDWRDKPYRLDFYDVTLITAGRGSFWLDTNRHDVVPGTLFFTTPGQVRRWIVEDLDGLCLFFAGEFLLDYFNDPLFLHRLHYFHSDTGPFELRPSDAQRIRLLDRLDVMHREYRNLREDSVHLLRGISYEILVSLNRWYTERYGYALDMPVGHTISRFRQLIERDFRTTRNVGDYARQLGVTPGHLNALCRKHVGRTAGKMIQGRVIAEARRLLVHTDYDVGRIGNHLGFADPPYFSRVFKRATDFSPLAFRRSRRRDLEL
jgi:AraC-like DNA-binding protein